MNIHLDDNEIRKLYKNNGDKIKKINYKILSKYGEKNEIYSLYKIFTNPKIIINNNINDTNIRNISDEEFKKNINNVLNNLANKFPDIKVYDHYNISDSIKNLYKKNVLKYINSEK